MQHNNKKILLIDAVVDGADLAREFIRRGYSCWHLWSSTEAYRSKFKLFNPSLYEKCIIHESLEKTLSWLSEADVVACVPVRDASVVLAEEIADALELNFNNAESSYLRVDRYELIKKLGEPALLIAPPLNGPMLYVVKPRRSLGGYDRITVTPSPEISEGMFVQPYYDGIEYGIDTVTYNGVHRLIAIYRYSQNFGKGIMHDEARLVVASNEVELSEKIFSYVQHVLETAEHKVGPAHIEIKSYGQSFRLIEGNFRIQHGMDYNSTQIALEKNQHQAAAEAYLGEKYDSTSRLYHNKKHLHQLHFINTIDGKRAEDVNWQALTKLPGVTKLYRPYVGHTALPSGNYSVSGCAAIIMIIADSEKELDDRVIKVREFIAKENSNENRTHHQRPTLEQ